MQKVKRFAQRPNKRFIMANSFARAVKKFRHQFTVTLYQLNNNIQKFYLKNIASQASPNTKT